MTVRKVSADSLTPADPTPGVAREQAIVTGDLWSGRALTEAGVTSGWHHHGDHDTVIYVVEGAIAVETTDGVVEGRPGDFLHVPPHTVHREGNPTDGTAEVVLVRRGTGPVTVNVSAPTGNDR
ncbi:MAG: hypothetical protein QOG99_783 [Frankiales bacterium]|jgi:uncharacterized RmlC-like cupin family protein|nr:hypothetical protein [Frankiales bacterium]